MEIAYEAGDELYEDAIAQNRYKLKHWWTYIESKRGVEDTSKEGDGSRRKSSERRRRRNMIHERAVKCLPGSYKLWRSYLQDREMQCRGRSVVDKRFEKLNSCYERALVTLHKCPRIWMDFCETLMAQKKITRTRRTFDRALRALPITQHNRIWTMYVRWVSDSELDIFGTAVRVWRRYLKLNPGERESYVDFLVERQEYNEAARQLAIICGDTSFVSKKPGVTQHTLWIRLCDLVSKHPHEEMGLDVDAIVRSGIRKFSDEVGRLWCALADHYIRLAMFEKARDIYEEAFVEVMTVRDFSLIFNAYVQFEESMLRAKIEMMGDEEEDEEDELDEEDDVDLRIARLSHLMDRRPLLLNAVKLRQNPHSVEEWKQRVELIKNSDGKSDPIKVITCYNNALRTIDPKKATNGKPHELWIEFARFYETHDSVENAATIFERATKQPFRFVDDLASVWCAWAELYMRREQYDVALRTMESAVREPPKRRRTHAVYDGDGDEKDDSTTPRRRQRGIQGRLYTSKRAWSLYVDLEESLGTLTTTRAAYDRMIAIKVATVRHILNYADLLIEKKFFEDAFKVYEKGLEIFSYPHVKEIWIAYLTNFVKRYEGRKMERARDLFEQVLKDCPQKHAKAFYLLYAQLEEKYGLMRRAMAIYDRACTHIEESERYGVFVMYIKKTEENFGVTRTRPIYEKAIEVLPEDKVRVMCVRFAEVERKLGEIDRARAIFAHGAQYCDPQRVLSFWKYWHDFEVQHGNEDTFREMLRIKRSVQAKFSQHNYMTANMMSENGGSESDTHAMATKGGAPQFVRGGTLKRKAEDGGSKETSDAASERQRSRARVDGEEETQTDIQEIAVPDAVFGGIERPPAASSDNEGSDMSALERFKRAGSGS